MPTTNKSVYEARTETGEISGSIGPNDWNRFKQTLRFLPDNVSSILDCGCDRGHWLNFVLRQRSIARHLGIDVSAARIEEAHARYPDLNLRVAYLENLDPTESFDVVTALETLEHIPDWKAVFDKLLKCTNKRLIVTVPYREHIGKTICIQCARETPLDGHLHVFSEDSFPQVDGWALRFGYIMVGSWVGLRRLYRAIRPHKNWLAAVRWLAAVYDRRA